MLTSNSITEGQGPSPESAMAEHKAGPRRRRPTHPGAIVKSALEELGMTANALAVAIGMNRQTVLNLLAEDAAVSPAMALRLGKFFGNGAEVWMRMQADVDLWDARQKIAGALDAIKTVKHSPLPD